MQPPLHSDRVLRRPAAFRRLTGVTPAEFATLLGEADAARQQKRAKAARNPTRRRKPGGGAKAKLPPADALLLLLMYYRTYLPHAVLGVLFGVDDSTVSRTNDRTEKLLAGVLRVPERDVTLAEDEIRELFFDSTERPTQRPVRGQRAYYSGKKRRHTLKTQVVVVRVRKRPGRAPQRRRVRIKCVSPTAPGSTHDKRVFDRTGVQLPAGASGYGDTAYLGTGLNTPARKPPKGQLTARQKAGNRRVGRKRVVVEHGIGKMKTWRIAAERWRNPRRKHTRVMKNIAGLHNRMFG
jgi:hypothetical protein